MTRLAPQREYVVELLIRALEQKNDYGLQTRAATALGRIGPFAERAIPALVRALGYPELDDDSVRARAADSLGRIAISNPVKLTALLEGEQTELVKIGLLHRSASHVPAIRSRTPVGKSISIRPYDVWIGGFAKPGSGPIVTAAKPAAARTSPHSSCRQRYSWLAWIPASRATADATAPGSIDAATIHPFSARDQRRRRSTDVITSTCVFVIELSLGLVL